MQQSTIANFFRKWRSGEPLSIEAAEINVPHATMWLPEDQVALHSTREIVGLLDTYDEDAVAGHAPSLNRKNLEHYLYMTNLRISVLMDALKGRLPVGSSVLEIGAFFGSFALPLQRLGYRVTAIDRYAEFSNRLDSYIALMEREGVHVVRASRETEGDLISALPQFDAVIAMAVIEHVPHTPKFFLEMMKDKSRKLIAFDTPNVLRYWNRKRINNGETIFQSIDAQFHCVPPWEGHHREYTPTEARWMMEQIGCRDVDVHLFDYNMLQFEKLDRQHIECLEACFIDPLQMDTILAIGNV